MPDDFDSVVADRCRAVEDVVVPADLWSRVQLKVLDAIPVQFSEEATMIDLEIPGDIDERHKWLKRARVAALVAAAVVIALVWIRRNDQVSPADQLSPTPARALFGTPGEELAPGTYYVRFFGGTPTPRVFVTIGEGWLNEIPDWSITNIGVGEMTFSRPDRVFIDACDASAGFAPGPVTTLDGLTAALTQQRGWAEITTPTDITVNGHPGKEFQRTAPADISACQARDKGIVLDRGLVSWENGPLGATETPLGWRYHAQGEIESLRVLDINSTIVIITTRLEPDHQGPAADELAAMLDSIRIEQA